MAADRRQRIARLLELRAKELEQRVGELRVAQEAERTAADACTRAKEEVTRARAARDALTKKGFSIDEWTDVERWVEKQTELERRARVEQARCARQLELARRKVQAARVEHEKLKRLAERLADRERASHERADQKVNDDSAAVQFLRKRGE